MDGCWRGHSHLLNAAMDGWMVRQRTARSEATLDIGAVHQPSAPTSFVDYELFAQWIDVGAATSIGHWTLARQQPLDAECMDGCRPPANRANIYRALSLQMLSRSTFAATLSESVGVFFNASTGVSKVATIQCPHPAHCVHCCSPLTEKTVISSPSDWSFPECRGEGGPEDVSQHWHQVKAL